MLRRLTIDNNARVNIAKQHSSMMQSLVAGLSVNDLDI